ncbi:MAG: caspase family protein [Planctomycetota bacterium]
MARQVAVVIGIERSGNLVPLPGARRGAQQFSEWARAAGFEVVELVDQGRSVTAADVWAAVSTAVNAGDVTRLFIFFAGHGVSKGLDTDFWLLSPGPDNPNEAVNVASSLRHARRSGVKHVAVFADACRTAAGKPQQGVDGYVIFPNQQRADRIELDEFYAAQSGQAAQEVVPDDAIERSFGVFTECLLAALTGADREAAELVQVEGQPTLAVTAKSLASHIQDAVEAKLEAIPGAAVQMPDPRPGSYPPNVLARLREGHPTANLTIELTFEGAPPRVGRAALTLFVFDPVSNDFVRRATAAARLEVALAVGSLCRIQIEVAGYRPPEDASEIFQLRADQQRSIRMRVDRLGFMADPRPPTPSTTHTRVLDERDHEHERAPQAGVYRVVTRDLLSGRSVVTLQQLGRDETPEPVRGLARDPRAEAAVDTLVANEGRDHFETTTGLTVRGAPVVAAHVSGGHAGIFVENGAHHIRGHRPGTDYDQLGRPRAASAVLDLGDGRYAAVAMFGGFLGTVVVQGAGVTHVSYVPAPGSRFDLPEARAESARRALARAGVAARSGRFQLATSAAADLASTLRNYKHFNPTLGVYAAYAYDIAQRSDQIVDMIGYYRDWQQPVPYDLVLLSGLDRQQVGQIVVPAYPLLTQGWAYLDDFPGELHPAVRRARSSLAPSLWATPTGAGGAALADAIDRGELP